MQGSWAVFLSGSGSNFQAMLELIETCDVRLVVSDKSSARGIARARLQGIPVVILKKPLDWNLVISELSRRNIKNIFLLGFMRIIPASFLNAWASRRPGEPGERNGIILNLHPSKLPLYPGLHSIEKAYSDGAALGATIHHVIPEVDAGRLIFQIEFTRARESSFASLVDTEFRVHRLEHRMVRKVVEKWKSHLI